MSINVIPKPDKVVLGTGSFRIGKNTTVVSMDELSRLKEYLCCAIGISSKQKARTAESKSEIVLAINKDLKGLGHEGYVFEIMPEKITIESSAPNGVFYGIQTLRQLFSSADKGEIQCMRIEDSPRFGWRGMMLDDCRHFFGKDFVKKFIDILALYKMNSFHWHLTEDQGWRIEIKKYPKLTQVGSKRTESPVENNRNAGDGKPYGGFYTQDDIRDIVKYAADRFINVVPEIEMPGHAAAAIAAYPEFGNTDIPDYSPEVKTRWGIHPYVFSPTEKTFSFLEDVLSEVIGLFPGKYLHIGGDEAPKDQWKQSPAAQEVMRANGLKDEHELQSYFIKRIEKFLKKNDRILIGWDEIQEGGLSKTATMMVWRDWKWADFALANGNCIVMAPTTHTYFDHYQVEQVENKEPEAIGGLTTLEKAYSFEPIPEGLSTEKKKLVLGAQAQLWSEYLFDAKKVEYMAFPRMLALSEAIWSKPENKDYDDFLRRLKGGLAMLDKMKVNYRNPF